MASKPRWIELLNEFAVAQFRQKDSTVRFKCRARLVAEVQKLAGIDENGAAVAEDEAPSIDSEVLEELRRARRKFKPMHGPHEGFAVILEELDELWDEVRKHGHDEAIRARMRKEAVQVAAMALRFIHDVCDQPDIKIGGTEGDP
jgi:hypothetical protein